MATVLPCDVQCHQSTSCSRFVRAIIFKLETNIMASAGNPRLDSDFFLLFWRNNPHSGPGSLIHEVSRSHTTTHHSRQDSSGQEIQIWLQKIRNYVRLALEICLYEVCTNRFNIQQLYALPTLYLCVLYLSENKQRLLLLTA